MTTTTNGERFTDDEHRQMAKIIYKRFGRDEESFCSAWRRLLQNNAENSYIMKLVETPEQEQDKKNAKPAYLSSENARHYTDNLCDNFTSRDLLGTLPDHVLVNLYDTMAGMMEWEPAEETTINHVIGRDEEVIIGVGDTDLSVIISWHGHHLIADITDYKGFHANEDGVNI